MKYAIIIADGAADYKLPELGGKTPLEAANKPVIDSLVKRGAMGLAKTVPDGYSPGSDVANMSILGYDPDLFFPGGRGVIEAASRGIKVATDEIPMRANIITVKDGKIIDYSADNIRDEESAQLMDTANEFLSNEEIKFYPGVSYRNLAVIKDAKLSPGDLEFFPPHDHPNEPVSNWLCRGTNEIGDAWAQKLNAIMLKSIDLFSGHTLNRKRMMEKRPPANMLWFWGPGKKKREMPLIPQRFGKEGSVITGIDLIRGLGRLAGLKIKNVPGATAYFNTDYEGKADAAIECLDSGDDFVVVHVEAPDEAGHEGKLEEKVKAIENIDSRLVSRIMQKMGKDDFRIGILPDHYTPIPLRTHAMGDVPFVISGSGVEADSTESFTEDWATKGEYGSIKGYRFIEKLFGNDLD